MSLILITPPVAEPVTVTDMLAELGYVDEDAATVALLSSRLQPKIAAARADCESYTRRAFYTQTWQYLLDGFPRIDPAYQRTGYPSEILIPQPPFQRINNFTYVDVAGQVQTLSVDLSYGNDISLYYGYQLSGSGSDQPARVLPPWARPWPPTRRLPDAVTLEFVAGYGGPITVSMSQGWPAIAGPVLQLSDVGRPLLVPGAGPSGADLSATIASVDASGNATASTPAATAVNNVQGYLGKPVPGQIILAIRQLAQFYYEQGAVADAPLPRVVESLLDPFRNLIA